MSHSTPPNPKIRTNSPGLYTVIFKDSNRERGREKSEVVVILLPSEPLKPQLSNPDAASRSASCGCSLVATRVWLIPQLLGSPSKHFSSSRYLFWFQIYTQPVVCNAADQQLSSSGRPQEYTGDPCKGMRKYFQLRLTGDLTADEMPGLPFTLRIYVLKWSWKLVCYLLKSKEMCWHWMA